MALPTLNWRKLAPVTLAANNVNAALDALYAAGTAATYADGSPRVQGQDCAWSWTGNIDNTNALQPGATTAVYCTPPTSFPGVTNPGTVIPQAMLWCGSTNAPTATLRYAFPAAQIDARTAGMLYIGQCKNPGAYSNWNSATPFTSGEFTGCARAAFDFTAVWNLLYMWESQEGVIVQLGRTSPQISTSWNGGGALLDPGSSSNAETDGRLYGVFSTGSNNYCASTFWSSNSDVPFYEGSTAGRERFGIFTPGTATINGYVRFGAASPGTTFVARGGEIPLVPVWCSSTLAPARLREIWLTRDGYTNQSFSNGGVAQGYIVGAFFASTAADIAILTV